MHDHPPPRHIAVIMDGNGRWARQRGLSRVHGHRAGTEAVRDVSEACAEMGVEYLTLYTFSTENWHRPAREVNALMRLLVRTLKDERATLLKNRIRLNAIGNLAQLPGGALEALRQTMEETETPDVRMTLTLAISYSGRWDIVEAARKLAEEVAAGHLRPGEIDEQRLSDALATGDMPEPDLLIRTGGDYRVSNFLLWQLAYTEIHISDCFWPDFRRDRLEAAVQDYQERERRFGRV